MYEFGSRVRFSEVDEKQQLTLNGVLNYFQDCCTFQSEDGGVGVEHLKEKKRMWVLSSWKIVIFRYPKLGEHIRVVTLPYSLDRAVGRRNFQLLGEDEEMAACADSMWVYMDTERMRPVRIDEEMYRAYELSERMDMEYEERRISVPEAHEAMEPFVIHKSHLDVNRHVNNGQYVRLAWEYLPEDFEVRELRAEYKRQAVLGNTIYPRIGVEDGCYTVSLEDEAGRVYAIVAFKGEKACS